MNSKKINESIKIVNKRVKVQTATQNHTNKKNAQTYLHGKEYIFRLQMVDIEGGALGNGQLAGSFVDFEMARNCLVANYSA